MTAEARLAFEEAVALEADGRVDQALVSYLKAQELSPDDTEIAYRAASALLQTGYLDEAQSQLRRIVFAEPDHLSARASLGNCQLLLGDTANALQNFSEVLAKGPDNRNALYGLASALLKENRPFEAVEPARHLAELLPDTPAVLTLFADTMAKTDQKAAAIAAYRRVLKSNPDYGPALLGLSATLLLRKRFDEVIGLSIRASELAPADPLPLELLSDALLGKNALEDAREAAEAALKLEPASVANHVRISVLSRKLADYGSALTYAVRAHDLDTTAREALNALGTVLAALKYPVQARSVLTGLATGKGLEPPIRKLVEDLVKAQSNVRENAASQDTPSAVAGSQPEDPAPGEPAPVSAQPAAQAPSQTKVPLQGRMPPYQPRPERASGAPAADDVPVPNVLGLQRQDRS
ncbi:tetratricopeptide repeat protein [Roseibium sp. AS2]|uniref:tetratricopeptide repeat protein n=1 Tax=Roseibium sp. AS2 TaxID=3135781 RepID=UPI00316F1270